MQQWISGDTLWQHIPANTKKKVPPIAFIAHVDTSPAVTGKNVKANHS